MNPLFHRSYRGSFSGKTSATANHGVLWPIFAVAGYLASATVGGAVRISYPSAARRSLGPIVFVSFYDFELVRQLLRANDYIGTIGAIAFDL